MAEPTSTSQAPRIAIKFGTSSSSSPKATNSTKRLGQSQPPSTLGKRQRPHALNHDSDSEEDGDAVGRHETVTSFGGDLPGHGAKKRDVKTTKPRSTKAPYVIGGHTNRDWKADVKARRGAKDAPSHEAKGQSNNLHKDTEPADQDKQIKWGLTVTKKPTQEDTTVASENGSQAGQDTGAAESNIPPPAAHPEESEDEEKNAMDALLGKKRNPAKDLIIKGSPKNGASMPISEKDAYRQKMQGAAEISTIEEYDDIPEGEFGAAMLRGMGWKGDDNGNKPKEVKRRPHLMGLGSKEDEDIKKAELAKKHGHRERRPRLDEYRKDREKEKRDRDDRHRDSYKSERERDRHAHSSRSSSHRLGDRDRDRDSHRHRGHGHRS